MSPGNLNRTSRINTLIEKVRTKLQNFEVKNLQGQTLGKVKNLRIDPERHINLVVSPLDQQADARRFRIDSKYIQKVDPMTRSLFVDFERASVEYLPQESFYNQPSAVAATMSPQSPEDNLPRETSFSDNFSNAETTNPEEEITLEEGDFPKVVEEEIVRLLEERLVVNRSKRKVGEVVMRKEVETRFVEVPVRREKLIVEQVNAGAEATQLAEIDLGYGEVTGVELTASPKPETRPTVTGEFVSPKAASDLLEAIALQQHHGCAKVRVELVLADPERQETYQKMFDRCSSR